MNNIHTPEDLARNKRWVELLEYMSRKYDIPKVQFYNVIYGETVPKWNFASYNRGSRAAGAFQLIPSTLEWLNRVYNINLDTELVLNMKPEEQLDVYHKYLKAWRYDGSVALGFMQAAPGKFYRLKTNGRPITPDLVVYEKGSRAWEANPGWRGPNGDIIIGSINRYYAENAHWKD